MRTFATYLHAPEFRGPVNVAIRRLGRFEVRTSSAFDGRPILTVWRELVY